MTPAAQRPLTVDQVARLLRCSVKTVRARAHELGGLKFGVDYVFPAGALFRRLDELALASAAAPAPEPEKPAAIVQQLPQGKARRSPPPLPQLVASSTVAGS